MRYNYKWTKDYNEAMPDNNYGEESFSVDTYGDYDFADWLRDQDYPYFIETDNEEFIILDDDEEPTGERYFVLGKERFEKLTVQMYPGYLHVAGEENIEDYTYEDIAAEYDPQYVDCFASEEDAEKAAEENIRKMVAKDFPDADEWYVDHAATTLFNEVSTRIEWAWNAYNEGK